MSFFPFYLQMTSPTAPGASPPRYSASMCRSWRRTPPTYSGLSFEPCGSPTPAPGETSRGLSSTRCVNWPFISTISRAQGWGGVKRGRAEFLSEGLCGSVRKMKTFILGCPAPSTSLFKCWSLFRVVKIRWILHEDKFKSLCSRL